MSAEVYQLFSSSKGNCCLIKNKNDVFLIDAGVSAKRIEAAVKQVGVAPEEIRAVFVTHEHSDHIKGAGIFARKYGTPIYATEATWRAMDDKLGEIPAVSKCILEPGTDFFLGDMNIESFSTPHDAADSVGYVISTAAGARFGLATDIGCVRGGWLDAVRGCAAVLLESNYDPGMLQAGRYPYELKRRIMSRKGHLSNDDAAEAALALIAGGARQLVLGHLSKENNFPELAYRCCAAALDRDGVGDISLCVANRDNNSGIFTVKAAF